MDGTPRVEIQGASYELLSIDGVESASILEFSRRTYAEKWEKRFRCSSRIDMGA